MQLSYCMGLQTRPWFHVVALQSCVRLKFSAVLRAYTRYYGLHLAKLQLENFFQALLVSNVYIFNISEERTKLIGAGNHILISQVSWQTGLNALRLWGVKGRYILNLFK